MAGKMPSKKKKCRLFARAQQQKIPNKMPSKKMPNKKKCRVKCRVKIRARKIIGNRRNPGSSRYISGVQHTFTFDFA